MGYKNFGYNLNWVMRVPKDKRFNLRNPLDKEFLRYEEEFRKTIPEANFISFFDYLVENNTIIISNDDGYLLSDDRSHLTLAGAKYVGKKVLAESEIKEFFN